MLNDLTLVPSISYRYHRISLPLLRRQFKKQNLHVKTKSMLMTLTVLAAHKLSKKKKKIWLHNIHTKHADDTHHVGYLLSTLVLSQLIHEHGQVEAAELRLPGSQVKVNSAGHGEDGAHVGGTERLQGAEGIHSGCQLTTHTSKARIIPRSRWVNAFNSWTCPRKIICKECNWENTEDLH